MIQTPEFRCHGKAPSMSSILDDLLTASHPFLLESAVQQKSCTRWSFFGTKPDFIVSGDFTQTHFQIPDHKSIRVNQSALNSLSRLLEEYKLDLQNPPVPFVGGGVGYFGFDCAHAFEELPANAKKTNDLPLLYWAFYSTIFAVDHQNQQLWSVRTSLTVPSFLKSRSQNASQKNNVKPPEPTPDGRSETMCASFKPKRTSYETGSHQKDSSSFSCSFSRNEYIEAVQKAKSYIRQGDIYQVNLSRKISRSRPAEPASVYRSLRRRNPAPYMAFLKGKHLAILSSSPEQFLKVRNRQIQTRPIKGTRPRSSDPAEDQKLKTSLLNSTKDQAELHMIVDLERNDLGKICKYGSVQTTDLHALESFSSVHHLVGTVEGTLRTNTSIRDILKATFPGGSITGAPKIRSLEIIDELEPTRRQVYTGALGWIGWNQDLEWNIPIRTIEMNREKLWYQVGGGIVADSDPESEYQETRNKAKGMQKALDIVHSSH